MGFVSQVAILCLAFIFAGGCALERVPLRPNEPGARPDSDERVRIVVGPERRKANYFFIPGSVFLSDGLGHPISEEIFCAGIADESKRVNHLEWYFSPAMMSDISTREF